ncbi:MAG: hypothetical protein JWN51_1473 [Phycisphaerales bacterium]|nr:hypothetical protein [Phycisphaerales bacterium]
MKYCGIFVLVMLFGVVGRAPGPTTAPAPATAPAPVTANIEELLDHRFSEVSFDGTPLDKALDILREPLKVNIVVNWGALHKAGVEPSTPLKLHLWGVTLRQALTVMTTLVGDGGPGVGYRVGENVITITSEGFGSPATNQVKVYDVRDLLDAALARRLAAPPASNPNPPGPSRQPDDAEELRSLIIATVDPNLWFRDRATVRIWAGRLMVRSSPIVQAHVAEFLEKLRKAR